MTTAAYRALRESAAAIALPGRGVLCATGEDRARLLHALSTNHIQALQPGQACYTFFLNAQGRILADAWIIATEDALFLDTAPELRAKLLEHIDKYIIADDVTVEDWSDRFTVIAIEGPHAPDAAASVSAAMVTHASLTGQPARRLFLPAGEPGAPTLDQATAEDWNTVRLENARPLYGADFSEAQIPQETGLLEAIHFSKGCYLGQEIVERVRSRGNVNRSLVSFTMAAEIAPAAQTPILADGKEMGHVTSAAFSPALQRVVALGYLRIEVATRNLAAAVGGVAIERR